MKTTLTIFTLTVLCVILICPTHSFAQNFVEGQMPDTFLNVGSRVNSIAFSPDGTTIASGSTDDTIKLWDVDTATLKDTLKGHRARSVAFNSDGTTIASENSNDTRSSDISDDTLRSKSWGSTIKLWDVDTATLKDTFTLAERTDTVRVISIAFSPDGTTIASGGGTAAGGFRPRWYSVNTNSIVKLWDVTTGTLKNTLALDRIPINEVSSVSYAFSIRNVAFSPDGTTLACAVHQRLTVRSSNTTFQPLFQALQMVYASWPKRGFFNSDGDPVILEDTIELWDVTSGARKAKFELPSPASSVAFSPDGTMLAIGHEDRTVRLWDVTRQPKAPKATLSTHGDDVYSVAFSPDGKLLASGSGDGAIRLWKAPPPANGDGVVNIADLVEVAQNFGQVGENNADINGDGVVDIVDLILVAVALGEVAGAPAAHAQAFSMLTAEEVKQWLIEAKQLQTEDPRYFRGILFLEQLLALLTPKETALLANYPNPFNPETWIPYQLAKPVDALLTIYDINGRVVRALDLGYQQAGVYQSRSRAAYWDGRNEQGESVASGVYFYTLSAGDFTATRKLLIRK